MTAVKGIDVSQWQGNVDFNKVKKAGYDFVMIRAGYGRYASQKDPYFESNYNKAKAAGLGVGVYWYSYATNADQAKEEAKVCAQVIAGKQFEYPIAFDIEDPTQVNLSNTVIDGMCSAFCDYMEKLGYYASVYSYASFLNSKIGSSIKSKYDVWLAAVTKATSPSYSGSYGIWQYSFTGKVNGINGDVDLNRAYKDYPAIMKSKGLNGFKMEAPKEEPVVKERPKGDINGDGKVDDADVKAISDHVKGVKPLAEEQKKRADVNKDGKINVTDVSLVAKAAGPKKVEDEWITYTVKSGDSLWKIATQYGTTVIELARINSIKDASIIHVGQVIKVKKK